MTSADPVVQEPASSLLPAVRVPLFVVVLGALFLLEDYGGWPVGRTWPALLVLWGALLIAGRRERAV